MINLQPKALGLAFILGLCAPWIDAWLIEHTFRPVFEVEQLFVVPLYKRYAWTLGELRSYADLYYSVVSSLIFGAVLGLPLGVLLKQRWLLSWLSFLVAYLLATLILCLDSEFGADLFLYLITWHGFLLGAAAVLVFTFIGHRMRGLYGVSRTDSLRR
jgi:hypothetical protein